MSQRIAVVAPSAVPFVRGGAERMCEGLVDAINELTPHVGELIRLPARESSLRTFIDSYEAFSSLDVSHFDTVISCKYPAWMIDHPNHIVYMQHPARLFYELYPATESRDLPEMPEFERMRRLLARSPSRAILPEAFALTRELLDHLGEAHPAARPGPILFNLLPWLDHLGIGSAVSHFTISATVARRPRYFPVTARPAVLIPPSGTPGLHTGRFEYLFTASRLEELKRIDLLIEAMRYVPGDVHLKIAGVGSETTALRVQAMDDPRIEFLGAVSDHDLVELYANALAVPFVPFDEDLGLITLEAFESGKSVVTCHDSGGPSEIVLDGQTGFVTDPTPEAVGAALSTLVRHPKMAHDMGEIARNHIDRYSWRAVLDRLLKPQRERRVAHFPRGRRRAVLVSPAPAWPPVSLAAQRTIATAMALVPEFDTLLVTPPARSTQHEIRPMIRGFEVITPELGDSANDCAALWHPIDTNWGQGFTAAVQVACRQASAVVLLDVGVLPILADAPDNVPVVVDITSLARHRTPGRPQRLPLADVSKAAVITVPSASLAAECVTAGVSPDRLIVLPHPLPRSRATGVARRENVRAHLAEFARCNPDDLRLVIVDPGCAQEAAPLEEIATEWAFGDDTVVILLGTTEASPLSLPERLIPVPDPGTLHLAALVAAADLVVAAAVTACAPSRAALEAIRFGTAVVATRGHATLIGPAVTTVDDPALRAPESLIQESRESSAAPSGTWADDARKLADALSALAVSGTRISPVDLPWRATALSATG